LTYIPGGAGEGKEKERTERGGAGAGRMKARKKNLRKGSEHQP